MLLFRILHLWVVRVSVAGMISSTFASLEHSSLIKKQYDLWLRGTEAKSPSTRKTEYISEQSQVYKPLAFRTVGHDQFNLWALPERLRRP